MESFRREALRPEHAKRKSSKGPLKPESQIWLPSDLNASMKNRQAAAVSCVLTAEARISKDAFSSSFTFKAPPATVTN